MKKIKLEVLLGEIAGNAYEHLRSQGKKHSVAIKKAKIDGDYRKLSFGTEAEKIAFISGMELVLGWQDFRVFVPEIEIQKDLEAIKS